MFQKTSSNGFYSNDGPKSANIYPYTFTRMLLIIGIFDYITETVQSLYYDLQILRQQKPFK